MIIESENLSLECPRGIKYGISQYKAAIPK
jgi:hypothetical protein